MKKHKEGIAVMHSFSISYPETYRNNNKGYGRADALYALVLYGALMLAFLGLGLGFRLLGDALTAGIVYLGEGIVTLLLFLLVFPNAIDDIEQITDIRTQRCVAITNHIANKSFPHDYMEERF